MAAGTGWKTYQDFVLKIESAGEGRYRVEARAPIGEAQTDFEQPFDERDLELILLKLGHRRSQPTRGQRQEQVQPALEFGTRLYESVIQGEVRDLLTRTRQDVQRSGQGLRLQLRLSGAPELADYTIDQESPCTPLHSPCGQLIGAFDVGCGAVAVEAATWGSIKASFH